MRHETATFMTATSYCEFAAESAGNYWVVRFNQDGSETRFRNMTPVLDFPSTSLTRAVESKAALLRFHVREYMRTRERALWWQIKDAVNAEVLQ